jgi:hypothetical protein
MTETWVLLMSGSPRRNLTAPQAPAGLFKFLGTDRPSRMRTFDQLRDDTFDASSGGPVGTRRTDRRARVRYSFSTSARMMKLPAPDRFA